MNLKSYIIDITISNENKESEKNIGTQNTNAKIQIVDKSEESCPDILTNPIKHTIFDKKISDSSQAVVDTCQDEIDNNDNSNLVNENVNYNIVENKHISQLPKEDTEDTNNLINEDVNVSKEIVSTKGPVTQLEDIDISKSIIDKKTNVNNTSTPESKTSESKTPESKTSESKNSESKTSESKNSDTDNTLKNSLINDKLSNIVGTKDESDNLIIRTNVSECVDGCCKNIQNNEITKCIANFINCEENKPSEYILNSAKKKLQCDTESCVLSHHDFNRFLINKFGTNSVAKRVLDRDLKAKGPRHSTNLLSNYNIDDTLIRWAREFKTFYPCPFSMIDFKWTNNEFNQINLADVVSGNASYIDPLYGSITKKFDTFGCVLNTDNSYGRGKHWVCMFADFRSDIWTIEYFNSSGNPPCKDVMEWMENQRSRLLHLNNTVLCIPTTSIVHQKSNTECGMYVLFYIRCRLDGTKYKYFAKHRIKDEVVTNFRTHVFRKY